ncbi:MAG: hypothetical protein F6J97_12330 [Leptolyngbya sp. SIO4C1]|nr:hypothetical protein [Leptolyngbya sp. SIO4C1]
MGEFEPVFPLKAIIFQILLLLVATALEAGVLRQRLRLGYQKSVQYAAVINLLSVVLGWFVFLIAEPLVDARLRAQIVSYILFDRFLNNSLMPQMGWIVLIVGLGAFFATLLVKLKGLELLMRLSGTWTIPDQSSEVGRDEKYLRARTGRTVQQKASSDFIATVLRANALSFSAILILLILRTYLVTVS